MLFQGGYKLQIVSIVNIIKKVMLDKKILIFEIFLDLVDNSGLRMVYTKNLRRFDSGILEIGHATLTTLMVPPNAESFTITGECDASCVGRVGVNIDSN